MSVPEFKREAIAALFLERQHLDRPRARRLTAANLTSFVEDVGGIQLDSINVLERAHYLTVWSRFGPYDRAKLDRMIHKDRVLFEYWAHAACLVPRSHLTPWRRAMADYVLGHTGWRSWLRKNARATAAVEAEIAARGPLANADFKEKRPAGASGWWNWKPATHALHVLWMTGKILVHSRKHFHKRYDLAARVLDEFPAEPAISHEEFLRWHVLQSLRAMGAATDLDLSKDLTFPRMPVGARKKAIAALLKSGDIVEVAIRGDRRRWLLRREDLEALAAAGRRRRPSVGTTFLSPFDSLLWHRERVKTLFDFDYRIEVYTPGHKRVHGYYTLPILHDGMLVGRVDAKNHREAGRLEVRAVNIEPWVVTAKTAPKSELAAPDQASVAAGISEAVRSLATLVGASTVTWGRVSPGAWKSGVVELAKS